MHQIKYVVFVGTLESADDVYREVASNDFIDVQLDLGGKEAGYVHSDADIDRASQSLLKASFYNNGQSRNSIQRIYVHKEISTEFINLFSKKTFAGLKIGDPMLDETTIGPLALTE